MFYVDYLYFTELNFISFVFHCVFVTVYRTDWSIQLHSAARVFNELTYLLTLNCAVINFSSQGVCSAAYVEDWPDSHSMSERDGVDSPSRTAWRIDISH